MSQGRIIFMFINPSVRELYHGKYDILWKVVKTYRRINITYRCLKNAPLENVWIYNPFTAKLKKCNINFVVDN